MTHITVWTIGHSNRSVQELVSLLKEHGVTLLCDVRSFPTSKVEHFKRERMEDWLPKAGIRYVWLGESLGGYRPGGYLNWMKTEKFKQGMRHLLGLAEEDNVCVMCMEVNPKCCHRRHISRQLQQLGARVTHIIGRGQTRSSQSL
ncbi:MAG: DUF488 domain-containing protein [Candidatus Bathyarchaeota archaeon]|nr:DUF488 domain-containing protein [Candidatus Bathyarchaeota archaeon]